MSERNQRLAALLFGLGGALRGDQNFAASALQLQKFQEDRNRREEEEARQAAILKAASTNQELAQFLNLLGPQEGAKVYAQTLLTRDKDNRTSDQKNYDLAVKQGYKGTFIDYMRDKKSPLVTIDQSQKVFEQEGAKAGFKTQQKAQEAIEEFSDIEARFEILSKQLEGLNPLQTGVLEELKIPFKRIAAGLNILPQEELENLSQQELFLATTGYIIPRMRVVGSGSTSDTEINLFRSSVPNIGNTVEGNKVLVGGLQAILKYNKKRGYAMDKYLKREGNLLGFGEFADKELGSIYESYNSDDEFDQKVKNKKIKAGDFVYDAINGQFRVLSKEDIEGAF